MTITAACSRLGKGSPATASAGRGEEIFHWFRSESELPVLYRDILLKWLIVKDLFDFIKNVRRQLFGRF